MRGAAAERVALVPLDLGSAEELRDGVEPAVRDERYGTPPLEREIPELRDEEPDEREMPELRELEPDDREIPELRDPEDREIPELREPELRELEPDCREIPELRELEPEDREIPELRDPLLREPPNPRDAPELREPPDEPALRDPPLEPRLMRCASTCAIGAANRITASAINPVNSKRFGVSILPSVRTPKKTKGPRGIAAVRGPFACDCNPVGVGLHP